MDRFSSLLQRRPEATPTTGQEQIAAADWLPVVDVSETEINYVNGHFTRSFVLPDDVEEEKLSADYVDGVLRVHLPKTATVKPKATEIEIK